MPRAPPAVGWPRSARRPRAAGPSAPRRPGLVLVPTDLVALDLPGILSRPRRAMDCTSGRTSRNAASPPPMPAGGGRGPERVAPGIRPGPRRVNASRGPAPLLTHALGAGAVAGHGGGEGLQRRDLPLDQPPEGQAGQQVAGLLGRGRFEHEGAVALAGEDATVDAPLALPLHERLQTREDQPVHDGDHLRRREQRADLDPFASHQELHRRSPLLTYARRPARGPYGSETRNGLSGVVWSEPSTPSTRLRKFTTR